MDSAVEKVKGYLGQTMRVVLADGRVVKGTFQV